MSAAKSKTKRLKVLTPKIMKATETIIKKLLHECIRVEQRKTRSIFPAFNINNPDYAHAFGILAGLEILNYGYFGPVNLDAFQDEQAFWNSYRFPIRNITHKYQNLTYWFAEIKDSVREECSKQLNTANSISTGDTNTQISQSSIGA